uniref:Acyl carrier protein n=1 Tax=Oryza nivara TaxID=4536 RepID=A0A0E0IN12_ORYNI
MGGVDLMGVWSTFALRNMLHMLIKAINVSSVSFAGLRKNNVAFTLQPVTQRFAVLRAAKKETVEKVCDIVKKQLVLPEGTDVTGASKFTDLGADSLDTVEIVMGLEEAFKISVDESSAQSIATVEDAAELIDKIVSNAK